jgi:hypothetical protein
MYRRGPNAKAAKALFQEAPDEPLLAAKRRRFTSKTVDEGCDDEATPMDVDSDIAFAFVREDLMYLALEQGGKVQGTGQVLGGHASAEQVRKEILTQISTEGVLGSSSLIFVNEGQETSWQGTDPDSTLRLMPADLDLATVSSHSFRERSQSLGQIEFIGYF